MNADGRDWIERARAVRIEDEIARRGIRLRGKIERVGPCAVCGGNDRFSINTRKQVWNCRGCGAGGDIIAMVQHLDGCEFERAVTTLAGEPPRKSNRHDSANTGKSRLVGTWVYKDADERPYLKVERFEKPDGTKSYPQSHWDGMRWTSGKPAGPKIPYRLPELLDSDRTEPAWITEGEKCADAVAGLGLTAATASEGASKWTSDLNEWFRGRIAYILPDHDRPGAKHAAQVAENLAGVACEVRIVALPGLTEGEDVYDWIARGGTREQPEALAAAAPPWDPGEGPEAQEHDNVGGPSRNRPRKHDAVIAAALDGLKTAAAPQSMTFPPLNYIVPRLITLMSSDVLCQAPYARLGRLHAPA
jgi:hypothetical protein